MIILKSKKHYNLSVGRVDGQESKAVHFFELLTALKLKSAGRREGGSKNHTNSREFG